jgi:predicted RNA binding protein YcfA (HicA-like mRNA interferase family)
MKRGEILKLIKKEGAVFIEHGTKHDKYYSSKTGKTFLIPRHKRELATGTADNILKAAGVR